MVLKATIKVLLILRKIRGKTEVFNKRRHFTSSLWFETMHNCYKCCSFFMFFKICVMHDFTWIIFTWNHTDDINRFGIKYQFETHKNRIVIVAYANRLLNKWISVNIRHKTATPHCSISLNCICTQNTNLSLSLDMKMILKKSCKKDQIAVNANARPISNVKH